MSADLRRVVKGPDGSRYEIVGVAKDWKLGTGSVLLDAAAFLWAVVRQARGKEWVVEVRRVESKSDPVLSSVARTREEAASSVAELAEGSRTVDSLRELNRAVCHWSRRVRDLYDFQV